MAHSEPNNDEEMVYNWASKEEVIHQLHREGKTQDEILELLRQEDFAPSKRAYQNQLSKWNFTPRRNTASENPDLVREVEELWKRHVTPKEMLRELTEKGFEVGERELARLRVDRGLRYRADNTPKEKGMEEASLASSVKMGATTINGQEEEDIFESDNQLIRVMHTSLHRTTSPIPALPSAQAVTKRKRGNRPRPLNKIAIGQLVQQYPRPTEEDIAARAVERTRLAADKAASQEVRLSRRSKQNPGSKKFPSEMTLTQAQTHLSIDKRAYKDMKDTFTTICHNAGIERKAGCGIWEDAKRQLVTSIPELHAAFVDANGQPITGDEEKMKTLALDLLCQDVTKNSRRRKTRMDVRQAKTVLGLTPNEVASIRAALMARLKADGFTTMTESNGRWRACRDAWIEEQGLGGKDEMDRRAVEVICQDVMKRMAGGTAKARSVEKRYSSRSQSAQTTAQVASINGVEQTGESGEVEKKVADQDADNMTTLATPMQTVTTNEDYGRKQENGVDRLRSMRYASYGEYAVAHQSSYPSVAAFNAHPSPAARPAYTSATAHNPYSASFTPSLYFPTTAAPNAYSSSALSSPLLPTTAAQAHYSSNFASSTYPPASSPNLFAHEFAPPAYPTSRRSSSDSGTYPEIDPDLLYGTFKPN